TVSNPGEPTKGELADPRGPFRNAFGGRVRFLDEKQRRSVPFSGPPGLTGRLSVARGGGGGGTSVGGRIRSAGGPVGDRRRPRRPPVPIARVRRAGSYRWRNAPVGLRTVETSYVPVPVPHVSPPASAALPAAGPARPRRGAAWTRRRG